MQEEFEVQYHPGHVRKILHEMGFSVQLPSGCWPEPIARSRTAGTAGRASYAAMLLKSGVSHCLFSRFWPKIAHFF
jgi:hypothetical protein